MCLHGCIIFLQQYSACYGNYKADRFHEKTAHQAVQSAIQGIDLR